MPLLKIFDQLLSIIFPKDKIALEIENLSEENMFAIDPANEIHDTKLKSLFLYKQKIVRQAIWEIKYRKNMIILEKFTKPLYDFILEDISDEILFGNFKNPVLIPIPSSKRRQNERGFNQAELIARKIFTIDQGKNFSLATDWLIKIKETPHQSELKNRHDRLKNLESAFSCLKEKCTGQNIILIDDVITTGRTMHEAIQTLKDAGAKNVLGFSIAH